MLIVLSFRLGSKRSAQTDTQRELLPDYVIALNRHVGQDIVVTCREGLDSKPLEHRGRITEPSLYDKFFTLYGSGHSQKLIHWQRDTDFRQEVLSIKTADETIIYQFE